MNDFDVVREALGELSTYGDHAAHNPLNMPAVKALDRIEADNAELHAIAEQATMRAEQALAERDRYKAALERIATMEPDVSVGGHRAAALAIARQALEGTNDEA
jgi:hypothetical protein